MERERGRESEMFNKNEYHSCGSQDKKILGVKKNRAKEVPDYVKEY